MFEASDSRCDGCGTEDRRSDSAKRFQNYVIYRQDTPFLIVNAAVVHVRNLVVKFAANEPDYAWTFQPY